MSRQIHELAGIITADVGAFVRGIGKVVQATESMRQKWVDAAKSIDRAANRVGLAVGAMGGFLAKAGLEFNSLMESSTIAFTTMLGSAEKAQAFLAELSDFARRTPFDMPGLTKAAQQLLNARFAAEQVIPLLTAVGEAAAAAGGDPEKLHRTIVALGQIQSKSRLLAEEMKQLNEAGTFSWGALAGQLGVSVAEAMDLASKGQISAEKAIDAFIAHSTQAFGGMMEQQSKTFSGQLSTLKDNINVNAGTIFLPLSTALTDLFSHINTQAQNSGFNAFVADAQEKVRELIAAVREAAPAIQQTAREVYEFLKPIARFLAEHPRLLSMLMLFKAGQTLGINQALLALGKALGATGVHVALLASKLAGYAASADKATLKSAAFKGAIVAIAIAAVRHFAIAISEVNKFNAAMKQAADDTKELADRTKAGYDGVLAKAEELTGQERDDYLNEQLRTAQVNLEGLKFQLSAAKKDVENADTVWKNLGGSLLSGNKELENAEARLAEANDRLKAQKEFVAQLQELSKPSGDSGAKPVGASMAESFADGVVSEAGEIGAAIGEGAAEAIEQALAKAHDIELERQAKGAKGVRDILGLEGLQPDQFERLLGAQAGATPELAASQASLFGSLGSWRKDETDPSRPDVFANTMSPEQLDEFAVMIARDINLAQSDANRAEMFQTEGTPLFTEFMRSIQTLQDDSTLTADVVADLAGGALQLRDDLASGKITIDQFRNGLSGLDQATRQAVEAVKEKEAQERRAALLRGDFKGAGLNLQEALDDKIASLRMQQFNQQAEIAFEQWMRLNGIVDLAGTGLSKLGQGAEKLRQTFEDWGDEFDGQMGGGGNFQQGMEALGAWLNSTQGLIASIVNGISFLEQQLALGNSGGRERLSILERIANLQQQLVDLASAPAPLTLTSAEDLFTDPGLQTDQEGSSGEVASTGRGGITINMQVDSLDLNGAGARRFLDSVNLELQRRGHSRFF